MSWSHLPRRFHLFLVLVCLQTLGQTPVGRCDAPVDNDVPRLEAEVIEGLKEKIKLQLERQGIPGLSMAIAVDGEIVFDEGFGMADVEHQVKATPATMYRTASIAKSMTAVAVMQLAQQGKLDLDKPVHDYLPSFPEKEWSFTTRQLLAHLAGVRHYQGRQESLSIRHYRNVRGGLATFADDPLLHEPGTKFEYSTFGYNLLGAIVEEVSGESFDDYLAKHVYKPAGMTSTCVDHHFRIVPHRASGYVRMRPARRGEFPRTLRGVFERDELYNAPLHDTSVKVPGGGLLATPSDLVRFATGLDNGKLLPGECIEEMWIEQKTTAGEETGYGLGFRIYTLDGEKVVGHSGGQAGVATLYMLCPDTNVAAAVMCNLQHAEVQGLCKAALRAGNAVTVPTLLQDEAPVTNYEPVAEKLRQFIERERKQKDLPAVSLSLVDGDQIVWASGFGPQDTSGRIKATADSVYRVGSVSKLFTDMALMKLVAEGKIDLDADVRTYLPEFQPENPSDKPITLRLIMAHRAGLVREPPVGHYFDPTEPTIAETVASLNTTKLVYPPDTRTKYSNAAIAVVGHVIERVAGKPFEDYLQEHFLRPMHMDSSSFYLLPSLEPKLAQGWMWSQHAPRFEPPLWALGTLPAGNLYASANDLGNFLITVFNGGEFQEKQVLPADQVAKMLQPATDADGKPTQFGIGFRLDQLDGHRTFGHGGAVYGYATQVTGMPDEKIGVAAVASLDVANGFTRRLADYALRLMLAAKKGEPLPEIEHSQPLAAGRAQQLEGNWQSGDKLLEMYEFGGRLFALDNHTVRELRASGDKLVIDDVHGYGPTWEVAEDGKSLRIGEKTYERRADTLPPAAPKRWEGLIGEYGWDHNVLYVYESHGQLRALIEWFYDYPLTEVDENTFAFPESEGLYFGERMVFTRDESGRATEVEAAEVVFKRRPVGLLNGKIFQIKPVRPVDQLRRDALAAEPPKEPQDLRDADLVELNRIEPGLLYDIRYAGDRNFMGTPFYESAHAYAQRPAAEAVARAHQRLEKEGYGLLIHDAYRPWFVTKMFWDGTPTDLYDFVADPQQGSRHNRGCAVDLTLYDLKTKKPVDMVAGYDEFSPRSFPLYPGGTSQQRWLRRLLRNAMEAEGFTVYEFEWWHFDYKDWQHYPIGNSRFEELDR